MGNPKMEEEFTTLHVKVSTSSKVKNLKKLVSKEKGCTVNGYDSIDYAIEKTLLELGIKHNIKF